MELIPKEIQIEIISFLTVKEKHYIKYDGIKNILSHRLISKLFRDYSPLNKLVYSKIYRRQCLQEFINNNIDTIDWKELLISHPNFITQYLPKLNIFQLWKDARDSTDSDYPHYNHFFSPYFGKEIPICGEQSAMTEKERFTLLNSDTLHTYILDTYGDNWTQKIDKEYFIDGIKYRHLYHKNDEERFYQLFLDDVCKMYGDILLVKRYIPNTPVHLLINHPIYQSLFTKERTLNDMDRLQISIMMSYMDDHRIKKEFINSGFIEKHNLWYILFNNSSDRTINKYMYKIKENVYKIFSCKLSLDFIDINYEIIDWTRLFSSSSYMKIIGKEGKRRLKDIVYKHIGYIKDICECERWLEYINLDKLWKDKILWKEITENPWGYWVISGVCHNEKILDDIEQIGLIKYKRKLEDWIFRNLHKVNMRYMMSHSYTPENFITKLLKLHPEFITADIWHYIIDKNNLSMEFLSEHRSKLMEYYSFYLLKDDEDEMEN
ncbi:Hypothetical protein ORPV_1158 [Orpheovirus IHUMI-LCC2]|uniref:F-box domain-containing protein n=1 Tax=Orpheovirus IHUMI-LCC2 TaxID=2023057 RepID=A0A2I2L690_9VIRU|nr:Hypothetical protein ORPV_1158 [Orpheovirus IHUMI-LCC2]SNW63062.1 Hypothetical protein ORPV_1158 [Orpheovirus IHUMI-LCC2]